MDFLDLADDLLRCEAIARGDAQEFPADRPQLVLPFPVGDLHPNRSDERPRALLSLEDILDFELFVCLIDRVEVDFELDG